MNAVLRSVAETKRSNILYLLAISFSLLLSAYIDFNETIINPDAVCYLSSAEAMGRLGFKGAMQVCGPNGQAQWPFYSFLIYHFVQLTSFSYSVAAYTLDSVFSAISVLTFILIVRELGGNRRTQWLAAAVILLAHNFNGVREYIIRDHGFWAFYLVSIFCLLRFYRMPTWRSAFSWSASLLLATLFRIEGAMFLLALPITALFVSAPIKTRLYSFIKLNTMLIVFAAFGLLWVISHPIRQLTVGRASEIPSQLLHGISLMQQSYLTAKSNLAVHVLGTDSAKEAGLVLPLMLLVWYVVAIIQNLSYIFSILAIYALTRVNQLFKNSARTVLAAYIFLNVIITFGFLLEHMFLSKRYLIALSLALMLFVPFALNELLQQKRKMVASIAALLIALSAVGGIFEFGYSKAYVEDAGKWLANNVPKEASLYANDYQLMYYSRHFGDAIFTTVKTYVNPNAIADGKWKQYDYLAFRVGKKEEMAMQPLLAQIGTPVATYSNKRGDKVVIFKVRGS